MNADELELRDEGSQGKAAHQHDALLAQRREDPVRLGAVLQGEAGGDGHGLLPFARSIKADPPLTLQGRHPCVEEAQATELAVRAAQRVRRQTWIAGRVGDALVVENAQKGDVGVVVAQVHGSGSLVQGVPGRSLSRQSALPSESTAAASFSWTVAAEPSVNGG